MCISRLVLFSRRPPSSVATTMSSIRTPKRPRQVDAGLDREAHAGLDQVRLALDHVRRLVGGQADPVADAVDEVLAVAGVGDHLARGAVDLLAGDARADRLEAGLLGAADDLVHLALLVGRLADVHGAGRVGAVAVLDAAEVQHDHVAVLDHPLADLVVRVGAVGARADDGEVDLRVAVLAQQRGEVGGDLGLGPTGELHLARSPRTRRRRRRRRRRAARARRRP